MKKIPSLLARTNPNNSPLCKAPGCPGLEVEDLEHALVRCPSNGGVGRAVIDCVASLGARLTEEQAIRLDFTAEQSSELAVTWVLGIAFYNIWEARKAGKHPKLYSVRADLEAKVSLLREARRFTNNVTLINLYWTLYKSII